MAKWKLISSKDYGMLKQGVVYDENYKHDRFYRTVGECASRHPHDWQKIEDEFVLPEKWCIIGGDEIRRWQREQMKDDCNCEFNRYDCYYKIKPNSNLKQWFINNEMPDGHTEITYDQFIKYVYEPWKKKREDAIEEVKENLSKCSDDLIEELVKPWPYIKDMGVMVANQTIPVSKPYPKWMMVWDDAMINGLKTKRYVLCEDNGMYVAYLEMNKTDKERVRHWPYAEDIQEPVVYKCPYNKEVRCPMKDCCNGCENWKPEVF